MKSARRHRTRWTVAAFALVAAVIAVNHQQVTALRDRFIPKRWGVVEEGRIYRSGQLSRHLVRETLEAHRIQTVVDLTWDDPSERNHIAELAAIAELGIERKLCPLQPDGTGDVHIYAQAVAEVARAVRQGKPVLVHCAAGTQRTGGVVAFYRLLVEGKSPEFTFAELRKYNYDPRHSPKLLKYVNEHIADVADDLVRDGIIERIPDPLPRLIAN
jgi:protein tyrosine/serine phosphatase